MNDCISRAALEEHLNFRLNELRAQYGDYDQYTDGFDECVSRVEDFKPVTPDVPCRCVECKHYHKETGWCDILSYFKTPDGEPCSPAESMDWKMFDENDFCSAGEPKEDGNG